MFQSLMYKILCLQQNIMMENIFVDVINKHIIHHLLDVYTLY